MEKRSSRNRSSKTIDCLGLGIIPLDLLFTVPYYPEAGGKIDATSVIVQGGGPVPNTLVGLSRLGLKTAVIAAVGDDLFGQLNIEDLKREDVDARYMVVKKQQSAAAAGFIEQESGRRTIALHRDIVVKPADLKLASYPIPRLVHLDGRDLPAAIKLANWAHKVGAIVSFDIGSMRNDVSPIFPLVDHLVVADAFALPFTSSRTAIEAIAHLALICPGTIVVTVGLAGSVGLEDGQFVRQQAYKVPVADTTGAGDAFHAGYLYGLLQGWGMQERLRFGAAVAALKCTKPGARTGAPRLRDVHRFLKSEPDTYA
ncbi:MAG: hypothetical protein IPH75_12080 [bacterium]|nr:hypothetical protein [bacterium]